MFNKQINFVRIKTFIKALLFHIGAGFPKSSQALIDYRLSICNQCDRLDKVNQECMECGCSISNKKIFFNKLAWADQECPMKKWLKRS